MKTLLLLLISFQTLSALPFYVVWEIRTTGSDTNGGSFNSGDPTGGAGGTACTGGTDYSVQDAAQVTFDGATITAATAGTSTTITITGYTVATTDKCNGLQVTAGTNFTAGFYSIVSVNVGANTWTLDRNVSSGVGAAMVAKMGGALATDTKLITSATTSGANSVGQVAWMKAGTYTKTAETVFTGTVQNLSIKGYTSTRGDAAPGTAPVLITTSTNSTRLYTMGAITSIFGVQFYNITFSNTAGTRAVGFLASVGGVGNRLAFIECVLDGFSTSVLGDFNGDYYFNQLIFINSKVMNCTGSGITNAGPTFLIGSRFTGNGAAGATNNALNSGAYWWVDNCVFDNNTARGLSLPLQASVSFVKNSSFYNNTLSGLYVVGSVQRNSLTVMNCIFEGNTRYGIEQAESNGVGDMGIVLSYNNAYYNNTLGETIGMPLSQGSSDVTMTGSPFVAPGSNDFALNSTAGAGAAVKAVGFPGITGYMGTGYADIGALQSQGGGGSAGTTSSAYTQ